MSLSGPYGWLECTLCHGHRRELFHGHRRAGISLRRVLAGGPIRLANVKEWLFLVGREPKYAQFGELKKTHAQRITFVLSIEISDLSGACSLQGRLRAYLPTWTWPGAAHA